MDSSATVPARGAGVSIGAGLLVIIGMNVVLLAVGLACVYLLRKRR